MNILQVSRAITLETCDSSFSSFRNSTLYEIRLAMSHVDHFDVTHDKTSKTARNRSKSRPAQRSTIDNRPPWNNDTYIEGYDDVDEHGKFRKRGGGMPKSNVRQQEEMTKNWTETLREQHHQPQR